MLSRIKTILNINGMSLTSLGWRVKKNLAIFCRENQERQEVNLLENPKIMNAICEVFEKKLENIKNRGRHYMVEGFSNLLNRVESSKNDEIVFLKTDNKYYLLIGVEKTYLDIKEKKNSNIFIIIPEDFYSFLSKELL